ncbi:MAG: spore maturation protein [Clostridia bacterium]|jgi:spore maturation protein B|nr:spore maturation protein [Clostridia bacterium]MDD4571535.1 spore maturation protein [Clostridia bacterium]
MSEIMLAISKYAIPFILIFIPLYAYIKGVPVYESFVAGAAEGLKLAVKILPFLLGMLVAISVFRASGAMAGLAAVLAPVTEFFGIPAEVMPLALMRPLSGSGALAITADLLNAYGADSFIGRLASTIQGSTDTTFYILTVYFGAVGIKKYRHALLVGLCADFISFVTAFLICRAVFL